MKYQYTVKHNGVWYQAGEEIPSDTAPIVIEEPKEDVRVDVIPKEPVKRKGGRPRTRKD